MDIINSKLSMLRNGNSQQQQHLKGNPNRTCTFCKKREPWNPPATQKLKRCSRCRARLYCSRACQRSDWRNGHQAVCVPLPVTAGNEAAVAAAGQRDTKPDKAKSNNPTNGTQPDTDTNRYLDGLSEEDAMNQLIDAYRLRVEDERIYRGYLRGRYAVKHSVAPSTSNKDHDTETSPTLDGAKDKIAFQYALRDFHDFLDLAESGGARSSRLSSSPSRPASSSSSSSPSSISCFSSSSLSSLSESNRPARAPLPSTAEAGSYESRESETKPRSTVLPYWWNAQKRADCEWRASSPSLCWSNLWMPVEKDAIVEHYRNSKMPMKLRMLAEAVYGYNVMEQPR